MSEEDRRVDALVSLARDATPPPVAASRQNEMILRALDEAASPSRAVAPRTLVPRALGPRTALVWAMAAAAVAAIGFVVLRGVVVDEGATAMGGVLVLPTGDRVTTAPAVALSFLEMSESSRVLALEAGEALLDIVPLAEGQRFVVRTPELEVHVRGTVFSVAREHEGTVVRVYEGRVEVREDEEATSLVAGETYRSGEGRVTDSAVDPLGEAGLTAARRRSSLAQRTVDRGVLDPGTADPRLGPSAVDPATVDPVVGPATSDQNTADAERSDQALADRSTSDPSASPRATTESRTAESRTAESSAADPATTHAAQAPAGESHVAETPVVEAEVQPSLDEARGLLRTRRFDEALAAARTGRARDPRDAAWALIEAQALQGSGRLGTAADAYDAIAREARGSDAAEAAFRAATIRHRDLADPRGAARSLDVADFTGTALEERALGLRARALDAAGDRAGAAAAARVYLERYPGGGSADAMRQLVVDP